jgi:endogenous inhibitor of DNA gyrase (YacG/DUF329 family)
MTTTTTVSAPTAAPAASTVAPRLKVCPNCGGTVEAGGRGMGRTFCTKDCRVAFNNRMKAEGAVMAALVKGWVLNRHAKPETMEAEVCAMARRELTQIARHFIDADKAAGRPPVTDFVAQLLQDTQYADRARK